MKTSVQVISASFLALAISTMANAAWAADSILGTWRLVSWTEEETESKAANKVFGDKPDGLLTLTADNRMMLIMADPSRKAPVQPKPTDAEALQLYRTVVGYAGRYKTEGNKLIYYPEIDIRQTFSGKEQVRFFEVNGDRLEYKSVPFPSGVSGKEIVANLVWDRVK